MNSSKSQKWGNFTYNLPKSIIILFSFLILGELGLSFFQYFNMNIDGDLALIVAPHENYKQVLKDPFGFNLLFSNQSYSASNRFFAHWQTYQYFRNFPIFLQKFTSPIDSLYLSAAFIKFISHVLFLFGISAAISGTINISKKTFIFAALLISPLFQANGQNSHIGLVHSSITYSIFYSLSVSILCLVFLNRFLDFAHNKKYIYGNFNKVGLLLFGVYLSFNGSLGAPIIIILGCFVYFSIFFDLFKERGFKITKDIFLVFIRRIFDSKNWIWFGLILISLYSFYIGTFNSESSVNQIGLIQRFKLLPIGVFKEFTEKSGPLVLISSVFLNLVLLRYTNFYSEKSKLKVLFWLVSFCLVYTILLPFGGYRDYRPYIIRGDSYMPVIVVLIFFYGFSSFYLFGVLNKKMKIIFSSYVILISIFYTYKDGFVEKNNQCERLSLQKLSESEGDKVEFDNNCSVISWLPFYSFEESKYNGEFLYLINITKSRKVYRNTLIGKNE